jgi:hypothetical protein
VEQAPLWRTRLADVLASLRQGRCLNDVRDCGEQRIGVYIIAANPLERFYRAQRCAARLWAHQAPITVTGSLSILCRRVTGQKPARTQHVENWSGQML